MAFKYIEIKSFEGNKVASRIDVSNQGERSIDRVEKGMNINLNHEKYYTEVVDSEIELSTKKEDLEKE